MEERRERGAQDELSSPVSDWVRIELGMSWGDPIYAMAGELLNDSGTYVRDRALRLSRDCVLMVRFPDGSTLERPLVERRVVVHYYDHGGSSEYEARLLGVLLTVRGIDLWVPLEQLEARRSELTGFLPKREDTATE